MKPNIYISTHCWALMINHSAVRYKLCVFLTDICYSPVYVYPHSKAALMRAIEEDTRFLAENAIMDYSLLTCIDDQTGELVVGIIGERDQETLRCC